VISSLCAFADGRNGKLGIAPRLIHESYKQIRLAWQRRARAVLPALRHYNRGGVVPLYFFIVSIVLRIVFPLIFIVLAPAAFLSPAQGLALQTVSIFHCRWPVFIFCECTT
jgi:hypothetical protein